LLLLLMKRVRVRVRASVAVRAQILLTARHVTTLVTFFFIDYFYLCAKALL